MERWGTKIERSVFDGDFVPTESSTTPPSILPLPVPPRGPNCPPEEAEKPVSFIPRDPYYTFEQLVLSENVRSQLRGLQGWIDNHQLLYDDWELAKIDPQGRRHIAFNFYGPPGTGKTMCVEAIAAELGKKIIDINYAEIESKYVGETGKNIALAFHTAQEAGALLFFDEADSILGRRMTNVTHSADQAVNVARAVTLKQLDGFEGIVAFATNLPENIDSAFRRRIAKHVEIPLPDEAGRRHLWQKFVSPKVPGREKLDWNELVERTDGFSGGDIKNVVVNGLTNAAALQPKIVTTVILAEEIEHIRNARLNVGNEPVVTTKAGPLADAEKEQGDEN